MNVDRESAKQFCALSRHKNAFAHIFSIITVLCGQTVDMDLFNSFHAEVFELVASNDVFGAHQQMIESI